jgi:hypothetical protein
MLQRAISYKFKDAACTSIVSLEDGDSMLIQNIGNLPEAEK